MLSDYRIEKQGRFYIVTGHDYTRFSTWFSNHWSYKWNNRNGRERELMDFLSHAALLFFHKHNIITRWNNVTNEIDRFYEDLSTALYYKSCGVKDNSIPLEDVGLTICCDVKPQLLISYLEKRGFQIQNPFTGIWYISKEGVMDVQISVVNNANRVESVWQGYVFPFSVRASLPRLSM